MTYDTYLDLDDLGLEHGQTSIPFAQEARQRVLADRVAAVGQRPLDHAQRDLLLGGAMLDPACFRFRKLVKNQDPRLFHDLDTFTPGEQATIVRCRAYQYLFYTAMIGYGNAQLDQQCQRIITSILHCPPTLLAYHDMSGGKGRRSCNRPRQCPYCLSRRAKSLYETLGEEYHPGSSKGLVLLAVTVSAPELKRTQNAPNSVEAKNIAKLMGQYLRQQAHVLFGVDGGLLTFEASPGLYSDNTWSDGELVFKASPGLDFRSALLGEVPKRRIAALLKYNSAAALEAELTPLTFGSEEWSPKVAIRCSKGRDALRSLIFGESPSSARDQPTEGAFRFPPWHLADSIQWEFHLRTTRSIKLFQFFGDWKGKFKVARPQGTRLLNADQRQRQMRSRQNLRTGNEQRRNRRNQQLINLESSVRVIWDQLCAIRQKVPGRTLLQREAANCGMLLSDRQAREFIRHFSRIGNGQD